MDPVPDPTSSVRNSGAEAAGASKWMLPKIPLLVGLIGAGAVVTTGSWFKHRSDARQQAEISAIRAEVGSLMTDAAEYHARFADLRATAEKYHSEALTSSDESTKAWARERARCFDALVAKVDRTADEASFAKLRTEIEAACDSGDLRTARARLLELPEVHFPSAPRFRTLQENEYLKPLAVVSRQNPGFYRAFMQAEPEAGREDLAALRGELAESKPETATPQSMLKLELLSTVASSDDPLVADWSAVASASDYFDDADPATLASWRRAQRAVRQEDWQTAVAQMQSILRSTVRTRLPFRAAYARACLKNRPDDKTAVRPFIEEAAAGGDAAARSWMVDDELAEGHPAQAVRWLEAAVAAGDSHAVVKLVELYSESADAVPRDLAREAGALQQIVVAPDAPPLAAVLLARLYEEGGGVPKSEAKAFACYQKAAEKKFVPAWAELARRFLRGKGTPADGERAREWACRAFAAGEREQSVPVLMELMHTAPDRTAGAVQALFDQEQVAGKAGFSDVRTTGISVAPLQMELARYFDQKGRYSQAAQFYARSGSRDPAVVSRHAALTAVHPCETCGGTGKIRTSTPCPTCGGKGTIVCHVCDGRGYILVPGAPPCMTCGGTGTMVQDGKVLACATCGGTGKGKGSVTRRTCTACNQGQEICPDCTGGRIYIMKECPDCHGTGARALADS